MKVFARLGAVAAGGVLALAMATPAMAATDFTLQQAHQGTFAGDHDQECAEGTKVIDGRMAERADNEDGWHFVLAGGSFVSLTVTFAPDGDASNTDDHVVISDVPEGGTGAITFYKANNEWRHAYVFTPAGWLLVTATAQGEGGQQFVVSHTCAGEPGDEPTPSPEPTPTPEPSQTPTPEPSQPGEIPSQPGETPSEPGESPSTPADEEPGLPVTGLQVGGLVALGVALLGGGAALLVVRRRRDLAGLIEE